MSEIISENTQEKKRGRPKGSKDKTRKRTRPDSTVQADVGDNARFLSHDLKLLTLPKVDVNDPDALHDRVVDYFRICAEDDIKPSVASFALALGISRQTLFYWLSGKLETVKNAESMVTLKRAYDTINSYYEHMMNNGKINPVAGIFLMKNNMGYKDQTDYVLTANNNDTPSLEDIANRANLLTE